MDNVNPPPPRKFDFSSGGASTERKVPESFIQLKEEYFANLVAPIDPETNKLIYTIPGLKEYEIEFERVCKEEAKGKLQQYKVLRCKEILQSMFHLLKDTLHQGDILKLQAVFDELHIQPDDIEYLQSLMEEGESLENFTVEDEQPVIVESESNGGRKERI